MASPYFTFTSGRHYASVQTTGGLTVEDLRPADPASVGKYRLIGRLGSGGMGDVFLGQSPGGRLVAVKLIRADLVQNPNFRTRFAREVAAARRVGGIFTTPVVDADPDGEQPWLVTAYVDGRSLAQTVETQGPLAVPEALRLALGLAEGVAAIHAAGVVHRDLKPSNVLLAPDGPRIIDFGISRPLDGAGFTHTGSIVGSPGFMSPEQAEGRPAGPPSDIFSFGSVLTFAATGEGPFGSGLPSVLLYRIVHLAPNIAAVPLPLRPLIESCLAKNPAGRPTADAILTELQEVAPDRLAGRPATTSGGPAATGAAQPDRPGQPASGRPYQPAADRRWSRAGLAYIAAAAAILVGAGVFIAVHLLGSQSSGGSPTAATHPAASRGATPSQAPAAAPAGPRAVIEAYFAAINRRDFASAWKLGGDHLGESYASFVGGFAKTSSVDITSLRTDGGTVNVRTLATETTGQVQKYALVYIVRGGVIVYGQATLIRTNP
jgi:eukaryotic-like serine/threonine-protein kinase